MGRAVTLTSWRAGRLGAASVMVLSIRLWLRWRTEAGTAPRVPVDNVHVLNLLAGWAPDPALRRTILVDNPAALYRF
ncbi:MAG TPA: hypothetical protein VF921_14555 [Vicinamibacterales bacterium]